MGEFYFERIRNPETDAARDRFAEGLDNNIRSVTENSRPPAADVIDVFVSVDIENPRASRTVPFVSKATGVQLAKLASLIMSGKTLEELHFTEEVIPTHISVKEAVLPF